MDIPVLIALASVILVLILTLTFFLKKPKEELKGKLT